MLSALFRTSLGRCIIQKIYNEMKGTNLSNVIHPSRDINLNAQSKMKLHNLKKI